MPITNVKIKDLTVFKELELEFSTGLNVFIGENGTGKTHLLKHLYASQNYAVTNKSVDEERYFTTSECFVLPVTGDIISTPSTATVFIPAKDMLTHSKGFMSINDMYNMPFDKTYYDIISRALLPTLKEISPEAQEILKSIEKIIGGQVIVENEVFYLKKTNCKPIEFALESEGIKKVAIIWQLIMTGNIKKGSILFWDEPEVNINPSIIPDIVSVILDLSKLGVQVFVSTHDYIFAKYIEVLAGDTDNVAFHSFYQTKDNGVKCESGQNFRDLKHNSIIASFDALFNRVYDLNIGD
ncbi:MAG: hypothetical protein ATN35_04810 [Epulopiscium sp. Nele67-Bin004]|nr:MAG: hypothetical protein ATN35_04810 [Epulopiscium sp. Nele67-Bin004]